MKDYHNKSIYAHYCHRRKLIAIGIKLGKLIQILGLIVAAIFVTCFIAGYYSQLPI